MIVYNSMDFILDHEHHYILWHGGDVDRFLLRNGNLVYASTLDELKQQVKDECLVEDFVICHDCDRLHEDPMDCHALLDYWNCMSDLAATLLLPFTGDNDTGIIQQVYVKLYQGSYDAMEVEWSLEEKDCLQKIIEEGKEMLKKQLAEKR